MPGQSEVAHHLCLLFRRDPHIILHVLNLAAEPAKGTGRSIFISPVLPLVEELASEAVKRNLTLTLSQSSLLGISWHLLEISKAVRDVALPGLSDPISKFSIGGNYRKVGLVRCHRVVQFVINRSQQETGFSTLLLFVLEPFLLFVDRIKRFARIAPLLVLNVERGKIQPSLWNQRLVFATADDSAKTLAS